jgi:hypothetical protein
MQISIVDKVVYAMLSERLANKTGNGWNLDNMPAGLAPRQCRQVKGC